MAKDDLGILDAIEIAMDAELKAKQFYTDSASKIESERGKNLLNQLADFENNHYQKLKDLKDSLIATGNYIDYDGTQFRPFRAEISGKVESKQSDALDVLKLAIDAETKAKEHYQQMVKQTKDPQGKKMFEKLAEEEDLHRRILNDEFYNLSNEGGIWAWGE